jgi:hypothetical protein
MKIKAYTLFTESHKKFLTDYFIPTFPFRNEIELTILNRPQHCKSAMFETEGWKDTMRDKATCFLEKISECNENEIFMFIDPDIQFFKDFYDDIIKYINGYEIVFQNDVIGGVNTGFFAVRNNKQTRAFFKTIIGNLDSEHFTQEQELANYLLQNQNKFPSIAVKWRFLPAEYWTYGWIAATMDPQTNTLRGSWKPGASDFEIPKNIAIHHANWTGGVENKIKLLDIVRNKHKHLNVS